MVRAPGIDLGGLGFNSLSGHITFNTVTIMDVETLHNDILSALPSDPIAQIHLSDPPDSRWSADEAGFLHLDGCIYVLDLDGLHLWVLRYHHDHPHSLATLGLWN